MSDVRAIIIPERGTPVTAEQLLTIESDLATRVLNIDNPDELEEYRAQARALESYLRDQELQGPMLSSQRRCEARLGQMLPATPGKRTDLEPPTRAEEVVGRDGDRTDFRLLANALNGGGLVRNKWRECRLEFEEWRRSRRALVSLVRNRMGLEPELEPLPEGIFRCIVADPPWELSTGPDAWGTKEKGNDSLAYKTMSLDRIMEMPVEACAADDAQLYLWTTMKYVEPSYEVARAWGFTPSALLTWCKTPHGVGLGGDFRITTEYILYARRGNLQMKQICPTTWFNWPRGIHSEKPDEFYQLVETMTPAPYAELDRLELFARAPRPGWTVWGDEAHG